MEACLIVTYRCNARCSMCHTWRHPTKKEEEFPPRMVEEIRGNLNFVNITGGEPFLRDDLDEIIDIALTKTRRLVISTNGYFTDRIVGLAEMYGNRIGIRISIEGLPAANDELRGIEDGFDHALRTLLTLHGMGLKDIGLCITVSDRNAKDMIVLYRLVDALGLEFATAVTHNSYYFHKHDNLFDDPQKIAGEFEAIAAELLNSNRPKNWFRAYFNMGLANYVRGGKRTLPCEVGTDVFFLDPNGNVMPCNGSDKPLIMGNLNDQCFDDIWCSRKADDIRKLVQECSKECWMIGSASPAMKKRIWMPGKWVMKNKLRVMGRHETEISLDPIGYINSKSY
ncbi:MAG: radical SAM protein [Thermodesulfobacteriota bacterium]|nr:radical SAM protein [Thermodesulfobacteriota bacterium]